MSEVRIEYGTVLRAVEEFLQRYRDPFTRANREDLAQEAVIETWRRGATLRDPSCATAFARTVARRLRYQATRNAARARSVDGVDPASVAGVAPVTERWRRHGRAFFVGGRWIEVEWLAEQLDDVLSGLGPVNEPIVRGYYEGASCRELGERYGLPAAGVKARLHRSRRRIRESFAERAQSAKPTGPSGMSRRPMSNDCGGDET